MPLPKKRELKFRIKTNVQGSYRVLWQVVNRGDEAKNNDQLRGGLIDGSDDRDAKGYFHEEKTAYIGTHYLVCYLMRGGVCIGKSPEFVVNIE